MGLAMGVIGLGSSIAGGLMSALGASAQGEANAQMYQYQAQVARINAQIDKQNAEWTRSSGEMQMLQMGQKQAQQEGQVRTGFAASGLDVNSGSAAEVQRSQRALDQLDQQVKRTDISKAAYDYDVKSVMDLNQATGYELAAQNAKTAGDMQAMTSMIGTAGNVSSMWFRGGQAGMWGSGFGFGG